MARVSVYVPCFNGAAWLEPCLEALLAQDEPFQELLVVDDGSTDASASIAARYAPRVRLIQHGRNRGLAVARNTAWRAATGDVVASIDADVRVEPDWLGRLLDGFDSPRTAAVGGRLLEAHQERLADRWRAAHMAQHAGDLPLINPPALAGATTAIRRHVLAALGGYAEHYRTNYEDVDLQHRLIAAGYRCRYEPAAVAYHLRQDTAQSVLRTYWAWLRPPFEQQGAYTTSEGLAGKDKANAERALAALWQDFSGGTPELAYLSLLVMVVIPLADRIHAATLATQRDDDDFAGQLRLEARELAAATPELLSAHSAYLAGKMAADQAQVIWWGPYPLAPSPTGSGRMVSAASSSLPVALAETMAQVPRAWWPRIAVSRDRLAAEEGWL